MQEIIFLIGESLEGGYKAKYLNDFIFTEEDSIFELKELNSKTIKSHFSKEELPNIVRLHFVRDELITV